MTKIQKQQTLQVLAIQKKKKKLNIFSHSTIKKKKTKKILKQKNKTNFHLKHLHIIFVKRVG